jgi:ParB family chromosome partitioning protein
VSSPVIKPTRAGSLAELAARINAEYQAGEGATRRGLEHFRAAGDLLIRAKDRCGHGRWLGWVRKHLRFGDRQARKYMRLAREWRQVKSASDADSSIDAALRLLAEGAAVDGGGAAHVARHTGELEWYTPPAYLDAARSVLGAFDLDPASSDLAQERVRAQTYHTREDDGLSKAWAGRVWMNPPYASGLVEAFVAKLVAHYEAGDVTAAVVLVNNATETGWFRRCAGAASAICFPTGRIRFLAPRGELRAPLQGQALLYLGDDPGGFSAAFSAFGLCCRVERPGTDRDQSLAERSSAPTRRERVEATGREAGFSGHMMSCEQLSVEQ